MNDQQQRIDYIGEAVDILKSMKPVEADIYIKKLAEDTGVSEGAIRFEYLGNNSQVKNFEHPSDINRRTEQEDNKRDSMSLIEKDLIKLMILDSGIYQYSR